MATAKMAGKLLGKRFSDVVAAEWDRHRHQDVPTMIWDAPLNKWVPKPPKQKKKPRSADNAPVEPQSHSPVPPRPSVTPRRRRRRDLDDTQPCVPFVGMGTGVGSGVSGQHRYQLRRDQTQKSKGKTRFDTPPPGGMRFTNPNKSFNKLPAIQTVKPRTKPKTDLTPQPPKDYEPSPRRPRARTAQQIDSERQEVLSSLDAFETRMNLNQERIERSRAKHKARQHWEELRSKMSIREMQLFYLKQSNMFKLIENVPLSKIKQAWRDTEKACAREKNLKRIKELSRGNMHIQKTLLDELEDEVVEMEFDGTVFRNFLKLVVPTYACSDDEVAYIFQVFDSDKNGNLSFVEFFSSLGVVLYHRDKDMALQYVYHKIDEEAFGKIQKDALTAREELHRCIVDKSFKPKIRTQWENIADQIAEYAEAYYMENATEEEGLVSLDEFRVFVYSHPELLESFTPELINFLER